MTITQQLTPEDFQAMAKLEQQYYPVDYITPPEECYRWYLRFAPSVFCAKDEGKVVGFLNLFPIGQTMRDALLDGIYNDSDFQAKDIVLPQPNQTLHLFLSCAAVDPAYRNRPVMEALLQAYFLYYQELMQTLPCQVEDVLCDTVTPEGAHLARRLGLSPFGSSNHQSQVFLPLAPAFFLPSNKNLPDERPNDKKNKPQTKQKTYLLSHS